jgi:hypothetical protein
VIVTTLVIDTGMDIAGIFSVDEDRYIPYRGCDRLLAVQRIEAADEVVTFNGTAHGGWSDLVELGKLVGMPDGLPLTGVVHSDMRSICWSDRIWGKSLVNTYSMHFTDCPTFPDTHEGSNERDVYMTFKLWELWKLGKLKILDGHDVVPPNPTD